MPKYDEIDGDIPIDGSTDFHTGRCKCTFSKQKPGCCPSNWLNKIKSKYYSENASVMN